MIEKHLVSMDFYGLQQSGMRGFPRIPDNAKHSDVDLWCDNGDRNGEVIIWPWHANCLLSLGRLESVSKRGHIRLQFFM